MYQNVTNSTTKPPLDNSSPFYALNILSIILLALFSPVTVTGNALVCASILRKPSLRTPSYILLAGLAFVDFCTGLIVQPILVANWLIYLTYNRINLNDKNTFPLAYLRTKSIAKGCSIYFFQATILIMTLMSIERWLHMARRSLFTVRRTLLMIAVFLLVPTPLVVTAVLGLQSSFLFRFAVTFLLLFCLTLTSVAYFKVFRIIRRHQQQIHANESSQNFAPPAINFEKYKKSVFTILYILAVFYISYLPRMAFSGIVLVLSMNEFVTFLFHTVSMLFLYLSSLLNPLLYLWRMNDIRNELRHLMKKMFCRNS